MGTSIVYSYLVSSVLYRRQIHMYVMKWPGFSYSHDT